MSIAFNPFDPTELLTGGSDIVNQGYIKVINSLNIPPIIFTSNGKFAMSTNRNDKNKIQRIK
jgi:predicted glycosyltransferase